MAALTSAQIFFLKSQSIALSQVFDATGLSKRQRMLQMERLQLPFYYGGAVCKAGGHSLRNKAGHCIQCDTSKIAYQLRHSASGFVYLAYSESKRYVKVGCSKNNPCDRVNALRAEAYGGARDWDIVRVARLDRDAGRKEFAVHSKLEPFLQSALYRKSDGKLQECRELFHCDLQHAIDAFEQAIASSEPTSPTTGSIERI